MGASGFTAAAAAQRGEEATSMQGNSQDSGHSLRCWLAKRASCCSALPYSTNQWGMWLPEGQPFWPVSSKGWGCHQGPSASQHGAGAHCGKTLFFLFVYFYQRIFLLFFNNGKLGSLVISGCFDLDLISGQSLRTKQEVAVSPFFWVGICFWDPEGHSASPTHRFCLHKAVKFAS